MQKENITLPRTIDLDLPSGTLWSDMNLGAESVTDYGDYYMWGSTEPYTDKVCNWRYAPFNGGFQWYNPDMLEMFRKEAFPDGILSDQYDAAHVQLGGKWHIPTAEQFQELRDYTASEWTNIGKVKGRKFISKNNGNYIFIPAAGYREGSSVHHVGSRARLWSSTLNLTIPSFAYRFLFNSGNCYVYDSNRCHGFCVRPVQ